MKPDILTAETVSLLESLLARYPGVVLDKTNWHANGSMSVMVRIRQRATVARLAYHASDANMDFRVWPVGHNGPLPPDLDQSSSSERTEAQWLSRIQYQLQAREGRGKIATFCICLIRELVEMDLLDPELGDQLRSELGW